MRFILISFIIFASTAGAQDFKIFPPDSVEKSEVDAVEIFRNIKIDGILDEQEWELVKPSPRFTQVTPVQGVPPNFDTIQFSILSPE